jgi:hypothetical protein
MTVVQAKFAVFYGEPVKSEGRAGTGRLSRHRGSIGKDPPPDRLRPKPTPSSMRLGAEREGCIEGLQRRPDRFNHSEPIAPYLSRASWRWKMPRKAS